MSSIADITVYDGAATPVSHVLKPVSVTRQGNAVLALWREQLASVPTEAQVWATMKIESLKGGVVRTEFTSAVPVMETVTNQNAAGYTASPKVAYVDKDVYVKFHHPRSTITSRRLSRMLLVNIANGIATSVAAATSGPASELFDSQVAPT